jgi:hypothetical protein
LETDSHSLSGSAAAFKLEIKSAISASLAIGFFALEEGEASLKSVRDFYILKKNSSVVAVPRVSVAKKRFLKPYKASLNQLLAITQGEEDALYERQQWIFKLDRLEVQSDEISSSATASGKSTTTKTTTLQFHPFFFDFVCEVTEQYYTFDDVQAFTAMITYITCVALDVSRLLCADASTPAAGTSSPWRRSSDMCRSSSAGCAAAAAAAKRKTRRCAPPSRWLRGRHRRCRRTACAAA